MAERDEELGIDFRPALEAIDQLDARVDQLISKIGDGISSAFADGGKAGLDALSALDAPIKLNVDDSEIQTAAGDIAALDTEGVVVPILADAESLVAAEADIEALIAAGQIGADVAVKVDDSEVVSATAELDDLAAKAAEPIEATVSIDDSGLVEASSSLDAISASAENASSSMDGVGGSAKSAGSDLLLGAVGAKEFGGVLTELGGGPAAAVAGIGAFIGITVDKAIEADAAVRRLDATFGPLAKSLDDLNLTGLNKDLSQFSLQIGADDDSLRNFASRFFQTGVGAGVAADAVNQTTQNLIEFAGQLSVANPQLGAADGFINNLSNALARGGRALLPYGIAISAADIQTRALGNTHKSTAADLSIFDKQVAGSQLAIERYGPKFKEAFDSGLDNPLVKLRQLKTTLEEALEAAGKGEIDSFIGALTTAVPVLVELVGLLGEVGTVALPGVAGALEIIAPLINLVVGFIELIPAPLRDSIAAFFLLRLALNALFAQIEVLAVATPGLGTFLAVLGGVTLLATKLFGAQKEAIPVSGAYSKALSDAGAAAAALVTPTTSATEATRILSQELDRAQKAAAIDKLKPFADGLASIGVTADKAAGLFGSDADALKAISNIIGPLAVRTGAYKGQLADLNITSYDQAKALISEIRSHGGLTDAQKKLLDGSIDLNNERVIGIEQTRRAALAGDEQALAIENARGEISLFSLASSDAAKASEHVATSTELAGEAAAKAAADNARLNESLHDATKGFSDLEGEMDKTLGLFDKLAGRPIDVAKSLIDVKDKTAAFAKSLEGDKGPAGASASSIRSAEARVTAAQAALTAAQAKQAKSPTAANALSVTADQQKLEAAQTALTEAQNKTSKSTKGNTATLDLNTQAGRDNVKAISDVLTSLRGVTDQQIKNGDSLDKVKKDYTDQIEVLRKVAVAGGITKAQFDGLLSTLLATPDQVVTNLVLAGVPEAMNALQPYDDLLAHLPPEKQTQIRQLGAVDAQAAIDLLQKSIDALPAEKKIQIQLEQTLKNVDAGALGLGLGPSSAASLKQAQDIINAANNKRALGGIDFPKRYAMGGIADKSPRIVPAGSNVRLFGEPDTGGEAFIPLAADARRGRAVDITADVAGRFGYDLTPKSLAVGQAQMNAPGFDDSRMVNALGLGFESLSGQLGALRATVAAMEAGVTVEMQAAPGQSPEAQGARAGQAFRQVARSR